MVSRIATLTEKKSSLRSKKVFLKRFVRHLTLEKQIEMFPVMAK
jgi:hypothetical protein